MTLTDVIHDYQIQQSARAMGGLYALSGFDFQLRCHLANFVEHLVSTNGILDGGQQFAHAFEALSDFTTADGDDFVCVQAKRTLTPSSLSHAAIEFATIAGFLQSSSNSGASIIASSAVSSGWESLGAGTRLELGPRRAPVKRACEATRTAADLAIAD